MTRRAVVSIWLGFALAALFFYPLAVALDADVYYLQWQTRDLVETVVALVLLAAGLSGIVFVAWRRPTRAATAGLAFAAAIPLASLVAGVSRQLPYERTLITAWENPMIRLLVPSAVAAAVLLAFVFWPMALARWVRRILILVSPISLVVVATFAMSVSKPSPIVQFDRASGGGRAAACAPMLTLLFDELSFSYLYDDDGNVRPQFPEIGRFGAEATSYLAVAAAGPETLKALPSLLAARRVQDIRVASDGLMEVSDGRLMPFRATGEDGLFATAARVGFRTEIGGYYLSYCELLTDVADACRSLSFYNVSGTNSAFSPLDPVQTTLILWPRQFPFGLLKNPPFGAHQRRLVDELAAFARRPMQAGQPVFRFVHFSVPHLPFVFDADGYDPPFNPLRTSPDAEYVAQLEYVDRLVGELLNPLRQSGSYDAMTVAILADHGFRFGGRERDALHIPFLVKAPHQQKRVTVTDPMQGERLLTQVVRESCTAPQQAL